MTSLTEISISTRKIIVWIVAIFIAYLTIKTLIGIGISYWNQTHPTPIIPPDVRFNKLPNPKFTSVATSSSGMKFILETIEGRPPETTSAGIVYAMPKRLPSLLASQRAKAFAAKLGFKDEPEIINTTYYRFIDSQDSLRTLEIDITTMNYKLKYDYERKPQFFDNVQFQTKEEVISEVTNFIRFNNLFDESILKGVVTTDLLRYSPDTKTFLPATSLSNANTIKVNFARSNLNDMRIISPSFINSYIYALFTTTSVANARIYELNYTFWPIAFDDFATYPLRQSITAWQDLIDGYAFVVNLGNNTPDNIVIRNIYLAYYDSEEPQPYLQPIFVFEGDNDFVAYLPAISSEWLE